MSDWLFVEIPVVLTVLAVIAALLGFPLYYWIDDRRRRRKTMTGPGAVVAAVKTKDPPAPNTERRPVFVGQTVVEVIYSETNQIRGIITVDARGAYRVRTEFWDTGDWDVARVAFWNSAHVGTFTDTLDNARVLCLDHMAATTARYPPIMSQPTPSVNEADVARVIRRDFAGTDVPEVEAIVMGYGRDAYHSEPHRVRLAALKLAAGNLEALRRHIDTARMDFRDVLAAAEYPEATRVWTRIDRLSPEERQQIYDDDWRQYEGWLTRPNA
jgi:hypothetical protein